MPRLFYGNFDFEHRLADPRREPTKLLKRLNAELATSWLAIADDDDMIWTPAAIDAEFFRQALAAGLPRVVPIESWDQTPRGVELVPWGWSREALALVERLEASGKVPSHDAVRQANSRATSHRLEQGWKVGLQGARRISNLHELEDILGTSSEQPWVIKSEYGMSGRERIRGRGAPTEADLQWLRRRLGPGNSVFYEPWVERVAEVGIQIEIPPTGSPRLAGLATMFTDERGQYAGSLIPSPSQQSVPENFVWQEAIEVTLRAANELQSLGYFGPVGIDAMQYRDRDGGLKIRPLQDINARWTMGRLSLGFGKLLAPDEVGLWVHGSQTTLASEIAARSGLIGQRSIATSPENVGGTPCFHHSRLVIGQRLI